MKSDNEARPAGTFAGEINTVLHASLEAYPNLVLGGQLIRYGYAGLTTGLYEKYPERFVTFPVAEELMNSAAMGMALAGKRVIMFHVRLDFLLCGMTSLLGQIPIWYKKGHKLPITIIAQEGRGIGTGQGAEHSRDLTFIFQKCEGWNVCVPQNPLEARRMLSGAIEGDMPTLYVLHRRLFNSSKGEKIKIPQELRFCGASQRHMKAFYGN